MRNLKLTGLFACAKFHVLTRSTSPITRENDRQCTFENVDRQKSLPTTCIVMNCFATLLQSARTPPSTFLFLPIYLSNSPGSENPTCHRQGLSMRRRNSCFRILSEAFSLNQWGVSEARHRAVNCGTARRWVVYRLRPLGLSTEKSNRPVTSVGALFCWPFWHFHGPGPGRPAKFFQKSFGYSGPLPAGPAGGLPRGVWRPAPGTAGRPSRAGPATARAALRPYSWVVLGALVEGWNRHFGLSRHCRSAVNEACDPQLTGPGLTGIVPVADSSGVLNGLPAALGL